MRRYLHREWNAKQRRVLELLGQAAAVDDVYSDLVTLHAACRTLQADIERVDFALSEAEVDAVAADLRLPIKGGENGFASYTRALVQHIHKYSVQEGAWPLVAAARVQRGQKLIHSLVHSRPEDGGLAVDEILTHKEHEEARSVIILLIGRRRRLQRIALSEQHPGRDPRDILGRQQLAARGTAGDELVDQRVKGALVHLCCRGAPVVGWRQSTKPPPFASRANAARLRFARPPPRAAASSARGGSAKHAITSPAYTPSPVLGASTRGATRTPIGGGGGAPGAARGYS